MSSKAAFFAEIAAASASLRDAAGVLLVWADQLAGDEFPLVAPGVVRQKAHELARQGGRLEMAAELAATRKK